MKKLLLAMILIGYIHSAWAVEDFYHFDLAKDQQRFEALITNLRCLVCQNQNIAESNAPLASDLRNQIYQQIKQGEDNQTIINYLVARYGNFILYRPPFNVTTLGLWFGPFLALFSGLLYLLYNIRKQR